jgi:hypothetical protein
MDIIGGYYMDDDHLLKLNPLKVIHCLEAILEKDELDKIKDVLRDNVQQLLRLGRSHLRFAQRAEGPTCWRQKVSRGYYSVYCTSKAIRLAITGLYNADISDHKKIGDLPRDFPSKSIWEDFLTKFRGDRNLADYDHTVTEQALELKSCDYLTRANKFYLLARKYLLTKGAI